MSAERSAGGGRGKQFIEERQAMILKLVKEHGRVTVRELCDRFSVSVATVRADLDELERLGKIRRTHGGALAAEHDEQVLPFGTRRMYYGAEKRSIGKAAARMVKDGEVIFIDGGTTAPEMRRYFADKQNVTIITPSIEVAHWLITATSIDVYLLNGFLKRDSLSTIGIPNEETILQMNISKAFCGAAGFTLRDGLTDVHMGFVEQKRVICNLARMVIGLVDHTKIGVTSLASFAGIDDIDAIITDKPLSADMESAVKDKGIEVMIS
jgi:DeoR/GlpR family transcriptional regulator of sugar metabolism